MLSADHKMGWLRAGDLPLKPQDNALAAARLLYTQAPALHLQYPRALRLRELAPSIVASVLLAFTVKRRAVSGHFAAMERVPYSCKTSSLQLVVYNLMQRCSLRLQSVISANASV